MEMDDELISIYLEIKRNKVGNGEKGFVINFAVKDKSGIYGPILCEKNIRYFYLFKENI